MNRNGHLAFAALTASTVSWELHQPLWQRALSPVVALATAMAPDVDNSRWWQQIRKRVPSHVVRSALRHRGLTHSWLMPVLIWKSQAEPSWVFVALVAGYASHLLADALFGETGVPVLLWWWHVGLRLPMAGWLEASTAVATTGYAACSALVGPVAPAHDLLFVCSTLVRSPFGWVAILLLVAFVAFLARGGRREKDHEDETVH